MNFRFRNTDNDVVLLDYGINHGRLLKGLSENEIITKASEIFIKKYDIPDETFSIKEMYKSMIRRNSRKSKIYPIILNILEINEDIITTCYFSNLKPLELFSTLSSRNQCAILYLMENLNTDFSINIVSDNTCIFNNIL